MGIYTAEVSGVNQSDKLVREGRGSSGSERCQEWGTLRDPCPEWCQVSHLVCQRVYPEPISIMID